MMTLKDSFSKLLADTFAVYLKTLNYHWHARGRNFINIHLLLERQYQELQIAADDIAERMVALWGKAPATLSAYQHLSSIQEGDSSKPLNQMIKELYHDHLSLIQDLKAAINIAKAADDEGSISLLSELLRKHEKTSWMLKASTTEQEEGRVSS